MLLVKVLKILLIFKTKDMNLLKDLQNIFIPNRCLHCKTIINTQCLFLCTSCSLELNHTGFINYNNNPIEKLFWGRIDIYQAASIYSYTKETPIQTLLKRLKYNGLQQFGTEAARVAIHELETTSRFSNIDIVIPVPLHWKKREKRGYNQMKTFSKTIAKHLNAVYLHDALIKTKQTKSQTTQTKEDRYHSIKNVFNVNLKYDLNNKNVLIVDDILTTGATLYACINTLKNKYDINISIITIACVV